MVGVDDSRLMELAADPPERLLPVLDRASAMAPLVVLMAVLPGLTALVVVTPDTTRVADVAGLSDQLSSRILSPWGRWVATQPWRDLFALDQFPVAWLPVVPGYLATVVLVGLTWSVGCVVFRSRNGLLAAVLACCHTPVVMLGRSFEPLAISAVAAGVTIISLVSHLQRSHRIVSFSLAVSVAGLATTALLSASLVLPVIVMLVIAALSNPTGELGLWGNGSSASRTRVGGRWRGLVAGVIVLSVAATVVVGWSWLVVRDPFVSWLWSDVGRGFTGWPESLQRMGQLAIWLGWLSGPVVLGSIEVVRRIHAGDQAERPAAVLALAWGGLSCLGVGLAGEGYPLRLAESFAAVPIAVLAARGLEAVCDRRVRVGSVVAATCVSCCLGGHRVLSPLFDEPWLGGVLVAVLAGIVGGGAAVACRRAESHQRNVLMACLVLLVSAQLISGWLEVPIAAVEFQPTATNP